MDIDKAIKTRISCKRFNLKRKADWRNVIECIDMARYAPMAGNNFSLQFIMTQDLEKIQKLSEASQQNFIVHASQVVAILTNPSRTSNLFGKRSDKYLKQQAGAAIQNILLKATAKGLATCWIGHFVEPQVKEILGINSDAIEVEALIAFGYHKDKKSYTRRKIDLDGVLFFEEHKNKRMRKITTIDS